LLVVILKTMQPKQYEYNWKEGTIQSQKLSELVVILRSKQPKQKIRITERNKNSLWLSHFHMTRGANTFLRRLPTPVDVRQVQLELETAAAKPEAALLASSLAIQKRKRFSAIVARHFFKCYFIWKIKNKKLNESFVFCYDVPYFVLRSKMSTREEQINDAYDFGFLIFYGCCKNAKFNIICCFETLFLICHNEH
jgi:hypothetical protein